MNYHQPVRGNTIGNSRLRYKPVHGAASTGSALHYYVEFDGDSTIIDCGTDASLTDLHSAAFTVDGWFCVDAFDAFPYLISKFQSVGNGGWELYVWNTGVLYSQINFSIADSDAHGNQALVAGEWSHIVMSYNAAVDRKTYLAIDGQWCTYSLQSASNGVLVTDSGASLIMGNEPGFAYLDGGIQWLRITSGIRYPIGVDFSAPARCGPPAVDGTTIELWALDEGVGVTATASVETPANDGTITDGTWQLCT